MNAKCKKFLTMLLLVCVSIGAAGCSAYSNQRYYERAQLMMGSGEYAEAAELFHQLGEYEDSAEYTLYAAALDALQNGKIDLARANLLEIAPFKSADRYLRYLDALDAETKANSIPRWTSTPRWAALRTAQNERRRWKPRFRSKPSGRGGS